ncbi:MAG: hypothetical protein ACI8XO_001003 [Verrucomicrobiales bacterium]|jgi:hypothetical protein
MSEQSEQRIAWNKTIHLLYRNRRSESSGKAEVPENTYCLETPHVLQTHSIRT